jgi:hypothetical protein
VTSCLRESVCHIHVDYWTAPQDVGVLRRLPFSNKLTSMPDHTRPSVGARAFNDASPLIMHHVTAKRSLDSRPHDRSDEELRTLRLPQVYCCTRCLSLLLVKCLNYRRQDKIKANWRRKGLRHVEVTVPAVDDTSKGNGGRPTTARRSVNRRPRAAHPLGRQPQAERPRSVHRAHASLDDASIKHSRTC